MIRLKNYIYKFFYFSFVLIPLSTGIDKFFNFFIDWNMYLNYNVYILPIYFQTFMYAVGVLEILIGIVTFFRPKIGAFIFGIWLLMIAVYLLLMSLYPQPGYETHYLDVGRDIGLAIGAFTLSFMS